MTRKSRSTSSLSSTADGSSMMISRASCDRARAMLTICCAAADSEPTSRRAGSRGGRGGRAAAAAARLATAGRVKPNRELLVAEEDVVGDGQPVDQVELLVDRGDAQAPWRPAGRRADAGSPRQEMCALVGLVRAGQDLDQRGLAGAVLAEEAVHLAGADVEVDAVEGADAGELLDDAGHLEQRSGRRHRGAVVVTRSRTSHTITRTFAQR